MKLEIPSDRDPLMYVWGSLVPKIGPAAGAFSGAVYEHSTLELETFEAARLRMAQLNGCAICKSWRTEREGATVDDAFVDEVEHWATSARLTDRARAAAQFAELFATDHHQLADHNSLPAQSIADLFTDRERAELAMCCGAWMSFGRLNRIFGIDEGCALPAHANTRHAAT